MVIVSWFISPIYETYVQPTDIIGVIIHLRSTMNTQYAKFRYEMFAQMSISLSPKISKMGSEKHLKKSVVWNQDFPLLLMDGQVLFRGSLVQFNFKGFPSGEFNKTAGFNILISLNPTHPPHFRGKNQGTLATPAIPEATCGVKGTGFIDDITQKLDEFSQVGPPKPVITGWVK